MKSLGFSEYRLQLLILELRDQQEIYHGFAVEYYLGTLDNIVCSMECNEKGQIWKKNTKIWHLNGLQSKPSCIDIDCHCIEYEYEYSNNPEHVTPWSGHV